MNWRVIVSDEPRVTSGFSNDVVITSAESAEIDRLSGIIKDYLEEIRGQLIVFDSVNANKLRARGYQPGPRAWEFFTIAASRINDDEFSVSTHSYDSLSTAADDQYFVIGKKSRAQRGKH